MLYKHSYWLYFIVHSLTVLITFILLLSYIVHVAFWHLDIKRRWWWRWWFLILNIYPGDRYCLASPVFMMFVTTATILKKGYLALWNFQNRLAMALNHTVNPLECRSKCHIEWYEVGTLAFDGWAVIFGTARRGLGGAPTRPGPGSTKCNSPPSTASVLFCCMMVRCSAFSMRP